MKSGHTNERDGHAAPLRLKLPAGAVRRLAAVGIHCRPEVSLEYQQQARRYVVRGVESGGAVREMGRYVTFTGEHGERLPWLQPLDSFGGNGLHAIVVAPVLVSVEMFRYGNTYQLLIARHRPQQEESGRRPRLQSQEIFRGTDGHLSLELWGKDSALAGTIEPEFFTRSGERREIPSEFVAAARAIAGSVCCLNCRHSHYLVSAATTTTAVAAAIHSSPEIPET